ncbi:MAG TPA: nuclear transport factor 2 family protein [Candidatus Acidoferrales bacterium]|nr:nuclear transport factor 2 family protein [Candidatus Acidoferrales bacterium]
MKYMRRRGLRMFAVAALLPMMTLAQAQKPAAAQGPDTRQQLIQITRSYIGSLPANGLAGVQEFMADDVIFSGASGLRRSKLELIQFMSVKPGPDRRTTYEPSDFTVHLYDDELAIVNFGLKSRKFKNSKSGEGVIDEYFRVTGTFLKRDDKWQVVAWQYTPVRDQPDKKANTSAEGQDK